LKELVNLVETEKVRIVRLFRDNLTFSIMNWS
jgi:hypothetical protein